jgi:hypothetical protein
MNRYTLGGKITAGIGQTLAVAQLWNPSSTRRIEVVEVAIFDTDFDAIQFTWLVSRSSARGATPTATITPDADNAHQADSVPPSGAVLEMGPFTTQPTLATPPLSALAIKSSAASTKPDGGLAFFPSGMDDLLSEERPVVVPPGTGLVIHMTGQAGDIMAASQEVYVGFED